MQDSKNFLEICSGLSELERRTLFNIIAHKTGASMCSVWRWSTGRSRPISVRHRRAVSSAVNSYLGLSTTADSLWA